MDIKNRPRIPIPDEDPYSVAGVSSSIIGVSEPFQQDRETREQIYAQSTSSRTRRVERPPKLPPRENLYGHDIPKVIEQSFPNFSNKLLPWNMLFNTTLLFQPDYDDIEDDYGRKPVIMNEEKRSKNEDKKKYGKLFKHSKCINFMANCFTWNDANEAFIWPQLVWYVLSFIDDPYYCGLRARVPNFVKMAKNSKVSTRGYATRPPPLQAPTYAATGYASSQSSQIYGHLPGNRPPIMYHARSFESGLGITMLHKNRNMM